MEADAVENLMEAVATAMVIVTAIALMTGPTLFVANPMELRKRIPPTVVTHSQQPRAIMEVEAHSQQHKAIMEAVAYSQIIA